MKNDENIKKLCIYYFITLLVIAFLEQPDANIFRNILTAGFMFIWSLLVGCVIALVFFPIASMFFSVSDKTKKYLIDHSFKVVMGFGLLSVLFVFSR